MRLLVAVALAAAPALVAAHDLWVEPDAGGYVVRLGYRGGQVLPLDAAKVKTMRCLEAVGTPKDVRRSATFSAREVRFAGRCAVAAAAEDGGWFSLTADGEVNLPRTRVKGAVKAWTWRQYAKWVDARSPRAAEPLGEELEVVPISSLAQARQGDEITLRVLSGGTPVPKALIEVAERIVGETDARGEVRVRIPASGVNLLSASIRRPHETPEADTDLVEASLTFEVAR